MCYYPKLVPISTKLNSYGYIKVPCGKCPSCLKARQGAWISRIYYELKDTINAIFLTLTYRQDTVPRVTDYETGEELMSLCKRHVQLALKKFRMKLKRLGYYIKFKYFLCGEYGNKTKRPHYHIIFMGLPQHLIYMFCSQWQKDYGRVDSRRIDLAHPKSLYNTAKYVTKYSMKGIYEHSEFRVRKVLNPKYEPFVDESKYITIKPVVELAYRTMSKGIGLSYLTPEIINYHLATDMEFNDSKSQAKEVWKRKKINYVTDEGKTFSTPLPRYYQEKIWGKSNLLKDSLFCAFLDFRKQLRAEKLQQLGVSESDSEAIYLLGQQEDKQQQILEKYNHKQHLEWYSKSRF
jgi:hypothetical protein